MPLVSIILPTYNRAAFLPRAFDSIQAQRFSDWELIIIDDGSNDDTPTLVAAFASRLGTRLRCITQDNQGPNAARVVGLESAHGKYVAFFDSDDYWLPHHLQDCVDALEQNADVDWVYGACQMTNAATGQLLAASSFYRAGKPLPFLKLRGRVVGQLKMIEDHRAVRCAILGGFNCGLQSSVVRAEVFKNGRFCYRDRNVCIDQLMILEALKTGVRFAYFDDVHAVYNVHPQNSSGCGAISSEKHVPLLKDQAWCYETLSRDPSLTAAERGAIAWRLAAIYFWGIGYVVLWQQGAREQAIPMFRLGLRHRPFNVWMWKTYLLARLRLALGHSGNNRVRASQSSGTVVVPAALPLGKGTVANRAVRARPVSHKLARSWLPDSPDT